MCMNIDKKITKSDIIESKYIYSEEILSPFIHTTKGGKYSITDADSKVYTGKTAEINIEGKRLKFVGGILVKVEEV